MKAEYRLAEVLYYQEAKFNNEAKLRLYATELRMEFYLEILQCFAVADENVFGIFVGNKYALAAWVSLSSTRS